MLPGLKVGLRGIERTGHMGRQGRDARAHDQQDDEPGAQETTIGTGHRGTHRTQRGRSGHAERGASTHEGELEAGRALGEAALIEDGVAATSWIGGPAFWPRVPRLKTLTPASKWRDGAGPSNLPTGVEWNVRLHERLNTRERDRFQSAAQRGLRRFRSKSPGTKGEPDPDCAWPWNAFEPPLLGMDHALLTQVFTHIARHLPAEREGELVKLVQEHFGDDLDTQLELFAAVREGQHDPGPKTRPGPTLSPSGSSTGSHSNNKQTGSPSPPPIPPPGSASCAPAPMARTAPCSTAIQPAAKRSPAPCARRLSISRQSSVSGSRATAAFPKLRRMRKTSSVSWMRTPAMKSPSPSRRATTPRISSTWQTGKMPAKHAYLELVDGDDGAAYAWLAAGGFEPAVVGIPELNSPAFDKRVRAAAEIAAMTEPFTIKAGSTTDPVTIVAKKILFPELRGVLESLPHRESFAPDTRVALAKMNPGAKPTTAEVPELARDGELAASVFQILEDGSEDKSKTAEAFKTLSTHAQIKLASALASSKETAATLLKLAPPRVLADPLVTGKAEGAER